MIILGIIFILICTFIFLVSVVFFLCDIEDVKSDDIDPPRPMPPKYNPDTYLQAHENDENLQKYL